MLCYYWNKIRVEREVKREREGERSCWSRGGEEKEREMIENGGENYWTCVIALCRVSGREERWENESREWKEESGGERRRGEEKYISTVIFLVFFAREERIGCLKQWEMIFRFFHTVWEWLQVFAVDLYGFRWHLNDKNTILVRPTMG
jgi:hypothetical protein